MVNNVIDELSLSTLVRFELWNMVVYSFCILFVFSLASMDKNQVHYSTIGKLV